MYLEVCRWEGQNIFFIHYHERKGSDENTYVGPRLSGDLPLWLRLADQ